MRTNIALLLVGLLVSTYAQARSSDYCTPCERESNGHIKRSLEAKYEFKRQHSCPANGSTKGHCEGYIIDHIDPLKREGADSPSKTLK